MNPSFMAFALGIGKYRGGKSPPKPSEQFAFAKGKGVQQEASGPEKEAKVREHLRRLAVDARIRASIDGVLIKMVDNRIAQQDLERDIEVAKFKERCYPRSDMVVASEEDRDD